MPLSNIISSIDQFSNTITKCIATKNLKLGTTLHSHLIKTALTFDPFITNRLIDFYVKCNAIPSAQKAFHDLPFKNTHSYNILISGYSTSGRFDDAYKVFDEMPQRNVVTYNSLISGLFKHGFYRESINTFKEMQTDGLVIDGFGVVSLVGASACLSALNVLRQVHSVAIVIDLELNLIVQNALIDSYGKCGDPDSSYRIFSRMMDRDVVSWTSMVVAYAKASRLDEAYAVFNEMPVKSTVSWTALIAGFAKNGYSREALDSFEQMQEEGIKPNAFTFVCILGACAALALIESGKQIHGHMIRNIRRGDLFNVYTFNALLDMYCKCGDMGSAKMLFNRMSEKDIVSWNSLVTGFAQNGNGEESLITFGKMIEEKIRPNHVTFLGVLSACNHRGLVLKGLELLDSMERLYGVVPRSEHYAIMIDLLGRKNKLKEAMELIRNAPNGSNHVGMWGALLGACKIHGNIDLAETSAKVLLELESKNSARYVLLSNIYSAAERWDDAHRVIGLMNERGLKKEIACSWIELKNTRHEFVAKDKNHVQSEEIYDVIAKLLYNMVEAGYASNDYSPYISNEDDDMA